MYKHEFKGEEILRTAMSKFINLNLENSEDPDSLFSEAGGLQEDLQPHRETTSDFVFKDAIIRANPKGSSDVTFMVPRDDTVPLEQIQSTM